MGLPVICQKNKLPKLRKQLSKRKLMASSLKVILNFILLSVHAAPNFVAAINYFSPP